MSEKVRFNFTLGLTPVAGGLPAKPGILRVGRPQMKAAVSISLPPLVDPAVTERKVHVKLGEKVELISLKPTDSQFELIQPVDSPELTVTLSDFTQAGEGPESDPVTVKFDSSDFPPPKPGVLRTLAARAVEDSVGSVPDFGTDTPTTPTTPTDPTTPSDPIAPTEPSTPITPPDQPAPVTPTDPFPPAPTPVVAPSTDATATDLSGEATSDVAEPTFPATPATPDPNGLPMPDMPS